MDSVHDNEETTRRKHNKNTRQRKTPSNTAGAIPQDGEGFINFTSF
jgi:hypothetical protein